MKRLPPPATRRMAPKNPPPPPICVWVVIWTLPDIQESSPASEMTASLGSRMNSRTGMVVPTMRLCMRNSWAQIWAGAYEGILSEEQEPHHHRGRTEHREKAGIYTSLLTVWR